MIKDNFLLSCFLLIVTGMLILGCQGKTFDPAFLQEKAPAEFNIRFETTKGDFDVRIYAAWSPLAADRLYQLVKHKYLTILFSTRAGKDNRGSDLFINLADNTRLDTTEHLGVRGYPPLGEVIHGMEVVESLFDVYGDDLMQETNRMYSDRNGFMQAYPGLDYVKKAYLLK